MTDLLLAEHGYQVDDLLRRGVGSGAEFIALGPTAMAALDERGIRYAVLEDLCDDYAVVPACANGHRAIERLAGELDTLLLERNRDLLAWGMRPFAFHVFQMTLFCDVLRNRIVMLDALLRVRRPARVVVHAGRRYPARSLLRFDDRETLWAVAARLVGAPSRLNLLSDPGLLRARDASGALALAAGVLRRASRRWTGVALSIRGALVGDVRGAAQAWRRAGAPTLLLVGGYDWNHVVPLLRERGYRILRVAASDLAGMPYQEPSPTGQVSACVGGRPDLAACFTERGVDFFGAVRERMEAIWQWFPDACRVIRHRLEELVRQHDVRAVLRSSSPSALDHAFNQAARSLGVPVFVWQHGFVGYDETISERCDYTDLLTANTLFAYGRGAAQAYKTRSGVPCADVIAVGSARLSELRRRLTAAGGGPNRPPRRVLYGTNDYGRNGWYLRTLSPFSDRTYFRDQVAIVDWLVARAHRGEPPVEAVIKLHPRRESEEPPWVRRVRREPGIRVVKERPAFSQLLARADAVVVDLPTTTLLEALATRLPVFVLTRHWSLDPTLWDLIARRAVCAQTGTELAARLDAWLTTSCFQADPENDDFFDAFAVSRGAPAVPEAVAEAVVTRLIRPAGAARFPSPTRAET